MEDKNLYEVSFHLISTLPEAEVLPVFESIKKAIVEKGGDLDGEKAPVLRKLAYTMYKKAVTGYSSHNSAYFGWVFFNAEPQVVAEVKNAFEAMSEVLRFIIIKEPNKKEPLLDDGAVEVEVQLENTEEVPAKIMEAVNEEAPETVESEVVSQEELDKSLEKLTEEVK
jgi:ribosomal protein S6